MTDTVENVAAAELRQFIERIERLESEKKAIADDISDVKGEAKGRGFSVKAIVEIIKLRKKDPSTRTEEETILQTYMAALGMLPDIDLERQASDHEAAEASRVARRRQQSADEQFDPLTGEFVNDVSPRLIKQVVDGMQTEAGRAALLTAVDIMIDRADVEEENTPEMATENGSSSGFEEAASETSVERVSPQAEEAATGSAAANVGGRDVTDAGTAHTKQAEARVGNLSVSANIKTARDYRPHCQQPEACGASGLHHCFTCTKALASQGEPA